jgi:hypothetical protein
MPGGMRLIDKRHAYEESLRIPMLAYAPGLIAAGRKIPQLVRNIDLAPTLLDLAGIHDTSGMDGRSIVPLLQGDDVAWDEELLYEYFWAPFPIRPRYSPSATPGTSTSSTTASGIPTSSTIWRQIPLNDITASIRPSIRSGSKQ